jgi:L-fuculose-phosphate aldolase
MITAIGDVMREAYKRNWITTRDGNCSLRRRDRNILYITPSAVRKNIIYPESIVRIPIKNNELTTEANASGELEMHWLLQRDHKKTRCVLHLHPTYTIAAMMAGFDLNELAAKFPEIYRYTRVAHNVRVLPAVSPELAVETYKQMTIGGELYYDIVGQAQHGVCAVAGNPWDAFEHVERLEHICQIALASGERIGS